MVLLIHVVLLTCLSCPSTMTLRLCQNATFFPQDNSISHTLEEKRQCLNIYHL